MTTVNQATKLGASGGIALYYEGEYKRCVNPTGSLFLGNDDHQFAYIIVGAKMEKTGEYHLYDELKGRMSEEFIGELRQFVLDNKIERIILITNNEELRYKYKKALGVRMIFEDEKRSNNSSVVLRDWFARGEDKPLLRIWEKCREGIKANYVPTRDCMVRLLDYFDLRMKRKSSGKPVVLGARAGYG